MTGQNYGQNRPGANVALSTSQTVISDPQLENKFWKPSKTAILHIQVWYDGKESEFNLTGPNLIWGDFMEYQYYYLRQYFNKVGVWMKLEAYQASICYLKDDGSVRVFTTYEKVNFSLEDAFPSGVTCRCQKGGKQP